MALQVIIGLLILVVIVYFLFSSYDFQNDIDKIIDLYSGKIIDTDELNLEKGAHNFKQFTHAFWLYIHNPEDATVLSHGSSGGSNIAVSFDRNARLSVNLDTHVFTMNYNNFPLRKWVHVGIVMDVNVLDLYIMGKLSKTQEVITNLTIQDAIAGNVSFGNNSNSTDDDKWSKGNGKVAFYKYFYKALTQEQIFHIFKSEYPTLYNNSDIYSLKVNFLKNDDIQGSFNL